MPIGSFMLLVLIGSSAAVLSRMHVQPAPVCLRGGLRAASLDRALSVVSMVASAVCLAEMAEPYSVRVRVCISVSMRMIFV
jgi:hypothetical protein